jgi:cellulose synthase/poly-beta-1,6-N-acetylglucosamine synthase-like glycosyltransferase
MAFSFELKAARNWDAFSVTEDLELHAKLVVAGVKVAFAPEAVVLGEMPDSLAAARDQNLRWERGRLALARAYAPGLLADGLRSRRWPSLAAAFDLMIPPLSTHGLMGGVLLAVAIFIGSPVAIGMAAAVLAGIAVYVIVGLAAARAPLRLWLALGFAPLFIVWKAWLYAGALVSRRKPSWTRTRRLNSGDEAR